MKFRIEKKDFLVLLAKTQTIVEKRTSMPVLINVLIIVENGLLHIYATDLEVSLTDQTPVDMKEPGKFGANAKNLFELVKELKEGPIQITQSENNLIELTQGKAEFHVLGINIEEYPVFPTYTTKNFIQIQSNILKEMIEKTMYSLSNDESKYHLNGVFLERRNNSGDYRMVATDGYRLSLIDRKFDSSANFSFTNGVIIPRKSLSEIKKFLEYQSEKIEIAVEGAQLILKSNATILMIRLVEGKYPNYNQLIPENLSSHALINKDIFLSSIKRVSLLSNQKTRGVTLHFQEGKMEITSNSPELGEAKEEIEINYNGNDVSIGFNARYILDILNNCECNDVDFSIKDSNSPSLIRPHDDNRYTCVIMPMRF